MTTGISQARAARESLLATIGDDPRVEGVGIALTSEDTYRLKAVVVDDPVGLAIPQQVEGVPVLVAAA